MSYLDLSYLKENVSDDQTFLNQLLEVFLESTTRDVNNLNEAVESGEFTKIKREAHKVKSSFRSLGMNQLTDMLQNMETLATNEKDLNHILHLNQEIQDTFPKVSAEVKEVLSQGK